MQSLILATRNPGKFREISDILKELPVRIVSLSDYPGIPDVAEDGDTLEENALKKARSIFEQTKIPALADDTGLEVYALNMAPGVRSARYAGENATYDDNNRKLLSEMENIPASERGARFRTVAAFVAGDFEKTVDGIYTGMIAKKPRGGGGFGYDPLFIPDGYDITYAEMPFDQKNRISHRGRAFNAIKEVLSVYFAEMG